METRACLAHEAQGLDDTAAQTSCLSQVYRQQRLSSQTGKVYVRITSPPIPYTMHGTFQVTKRYQVLVVGKRGKWKMVQLAPHFDGFRLFGFSANSSGSFGQSTAVSARDKNDRKIVLGGTSTPPHSCSRLQTDCCLCLALPTSQADTLGTKGGRRCQGLERL